MKMTIDDRREFDVEIRGEVFQQKALGAYVLVYEVSIFAFGEWRDITKWLRKEDLDHYEKKLIHFAHEHEATERLNP